MDGGRASATADARLWTYRIFAAMGQPGVLGNDGDGTHRLPGAVGRSLLSKAGGSERAVGSTYFVAFLRAACADPASCYGGADRIPFVSGPAAWGHAGSGTAWTQYQILSAASFSRCSSDLYYVRDPVRGRGLPKRAYRTNGRSDGYQL